ncbi:MAG: hypothetical protein HW397_174 [Dehalococcoidia bacterium]|nr:hypothetical protein [Dehalococcoidia bacterium]
MDHLKATDESAAGAWGSQAERPEKGDRYDLTWVMPAEERAILTYDEHPGFPRGVFVVEGLRSDRWRMNG